MDLHAWLLMALFAFWGFSVNWWLCIASLYLCSVLRTVLRTCEFMCLYCCPVSKRKQGRIYIFIPCSWSPPRNIMTDGTKPDDGDSSTSTEQMTFSQSESDCWLPVRSTMQCTKYKTRTSWFWLQGSTSAGIDNLLRSFSISRTDFHWRLWPPCEIACVMELRLCWIQTIQLMNSLLEDYQPTSLCGLCIGSIAGPRLWKLPRYSRGIFRILSIIMAEL